MTPEEWHKVKEVLQSVLELDPPARADYLDLICPNGGSLRGEVESLLRSHDEHATFLEQAVVIVANDIPAGSEAESSIGKRLGPYQVLEQIGKGGMGEVFRACRADDEFQKQVAIKLLRAGEASPFVVSRFRNERQILASLDHPNIARLIDGGTTDEGVPYLVMELVEGVRIDDYCDAHRLPTAQRLKLFLEICSAVQYAHQRLIVHRDLKPSNILVTKEGVPKLLDFGIAKILDPGALAGGFENTLTLFRILTPGYASPEQVRGEQITTVSDVYSLGVILYELLTGRSPYGNRKRTPDEISSAACEVHPEKPSNIISRAVPGEDEQTPREIAELREGSTQKLRKRLRGDLDNIVLMAICKDPQQRYASVEQFLEDIHRHLVGLPVIARTDTFFYRAAKFTKRHTAGVIASATISVVLIVALIVTLHEVRVARLQRARAEMRLNDVRKLANSLMFDIHDSIQDLPGSTPARKMLIERAIVYLDNLSREPGIDVAALRELASGYDKVGDVQGTPFGANLGDTKGAMDSYDRALAIRERISRANPSNVQDALAVAQTQRRIAGMEAFRGQPDAVSEVEHALMAAQRVLSVAPDNPGAFAEVSIDHAMLAAILDGFGRYQESIPHARVRLAMLQQQLRSDPGNRSLRGSEAVTEGRLGYELTIVGSTQEAEQHFDRSLQISEPLAADPMDVERKRIFALMLQWYVGKLVFHGDNPGALRTLHKAVGILEPLVAADPKNKELRLDLATDVAKEGNTLSILGDRKQGLVLLKRATTMLESDVAHDPGDTEPRTSLASARIWMGDTLASLGDNMLAIENFKSSLALWEKMAGESNEDRYKLAVAWVHSRIGFVLITLGRTDEAAEELRRALELANPVAAAESSIMDARHAVAEIYADFGDLYRRDALRGHRSALQVAQDYEDARTYYQRSLEMWQRIPDPGVGTPFTPLGFHCRHPRAIAAAMAECNASRGLRWHSLPSLPGRSTKRRLRNNSTVGLNGVIPLGQSFVGF